MISDRVLSRTFRNFIPIIYLNSLSAPIFQI
jgi:hypothetical protein